MPSALTVITSKIDEVLALLRAGNQPNLSQAEFSRRTRLSRWTVNRYIKRGRIKAINGRIPISELSKFSENLSAESKGNNS